MLDIQKIRTDFPILEQTVYGRPLVYLDNGATAQKPRQVIDTISGFYSHTNSNIHRGIHRLSELATDAYEKARKSVQGFINAKHSHEIIFTKGTTDSINTVAFSFGERYIKEGDEILVSHMEHHSNIVPWQMLCERKGAILRVIPITDQGVLQIEKLESLLNSRTRLVAVTHISNTLGTINPIHEIIQKAHAVGAKVLIDGAQSIHHTPIDVQDLDVDFFVFSGHKMYGPTGIGVLYGKEDLLNEMPPYQGGGDMIKTVSFEKTTYNELPFKFEAGTSNFVGAIALNAAIDYIEDIGLLNIQAYESELLQYATQQIQQINNLTIYGTAPQKAGVVSFLLKDIHHYDTGMILDKMGIAVRTGTHCTEPLMKRLGIDGTVRASFAIYNTKEEVDALCTGLLKVQDMFG